MKRIVSIIFLFFLSAFFSSVSASTVQLAKPVMVWHCLNSVQCSDPGANCATGPNVVAGHRAKLTTKAGDLPKPNVQTTVFVCIGTNQGSFCTSGEGTLDQQLLGYNGVNKLNQLVGYEFQGLYNSVGQKIDPSTVYANNAGKLSIRSGGGGGSSGLGMQIVPPIYAAAYNPPYKYQLAEPLQMQDRTPAAHPRKWLALNLVAPTQVEMGVGGVQQGTFTFEGALSRCASINWDPYGIVFDSKSLEPVTGVSLNLLKKRSDGQYTMVTGNDAYSIMNPYLTQVDGEFSFYVPNGTYQIDVSAPNFTFPSNLTDLNPNYSKIYSDIYGGGDIVEKGAMQHRDIPIVSKTTPYYSNIQVIGYFPVLDKSANTFIVDGRVSHPLAAINVYGKKPEGSGFVRTRLLMTTSADKLGRFHIAYQLSKLQPTEMVGDIEFIKPDYTNLQVTPTPELTKNAVILTIDPIPNYLEGYAYGSDGKTLSDATVGLYLNGSSKAAYETTTDANGFYRVSSEYVPPMAFGIRYTSSTGVSSPVKTSQFIAENAQYLDAQKINLYAYRNKNGQLIQAQNQNNPAIPENQPNTSPVQSTQSQSQSNLLPIILILAVLGIGAIGTVMYFMKKK